MSVPSFKVPIMMTNMMVLALLLLLPLLKECDCACPTVGENIELSSDARIFDEDGSLTGQADNHVARLGDTVIFTCNIRDTDLTWLGSVVGGLSDAIAFNSSIMPGDTGSEGQAQGGAVVATLTEATPAECRTSTLSVDTSRVATGSVQCTNEAFDPAVVNRLESTVRSLMANRVAVPDLAILVNYHLEPPPSPSNIMLSPDTCTSVGVGWTEPASSDLPVTNYTITVTNLDTSTDLPMITETGTSATLTGLVVGMNYRVEIVSNDVIGPGGPATEDFVIDPLMPPTNVEYQLECRTSTQAQITWQLPMQGPLTPPPNVGVCWRENGGAEQCSPNLPPGTTMYTVTTTPNSEYTVRVELDNGCSTEDSSLGNIFDAAVIQDVEVTGQNMDTVAFSMEFAQCVEDTMTWDVEVSYRPITGICPGDSRTFDYPVDLTERVEFNNVTCTRDYTYTVTVTDESGTQVGEANARMFDTDALPFDCDPVDLGGTVDSTTDPECSGVLAGSMGSASIPNGTVCYNGITVGSLANYSCDEDFQLNPERATNPRVCQTTGMWSGSDIICSPNCDPNDLGGTVDSTTDCRCDGVFDGSIGSATIPNGVICYNGITVDSLANHSCDEGFQLTPEGATNPRMCQINGIWSGSDITCSPKPEDDADSGGLSTGAVVGITFATTFFGAFVLGTLFGAAIVYVVAVKRVMKSNPEPSTVQSVQGGAPVYEEPELIARERKIDTATNVAYGHTRF